MDLVFIGLILIFFLISGAMVHGCDKLRRISRSRDSHPGSGGRE
jgi:hypothetical protein